MWDFSVIIIRFIGDMRYYIFFVNTIGCNWYGSYHNYVYDGVDWFRRLVGPSTMVVGGTSMILVRNDIGKEDQQICGWKRWWRSFKVDCWSEGPKVRWHVYQNPLRRGVYLHRFWQSSQYVLKVRGTWLECLNLDRDLAL
jgi:hypothetical protein